MLRDRIVKGCRIFIHVVAAIFIVLSVLTYDASDVSFNTSGTLNAGATRNFMGVLGAYVGDLAVQLFGVSGALLGVFILCRLRRMPTVARGTYVLCALCVTVGVSGIFSRLSFGITSKFYHGGFLGSKLASYSLSLSIFLVIVGIMGSVGGNFLVTLHELLSRLRARINALRGGEYEDDSAEEEVQHSVEYPALLPTMASYIPPIPSHSRPLYSQSVPHYNATPQHKVQQYNERYSEPEHKVQQYDEQHSEPERPERPDDTTAWRPMPTRTPPPPRTSEIKITRTTRFTLPNVELLTQCTPT
ncbi:MAG: DNA translocase FtsK 4TM domain-containing protein, partial [Anaplasma sp.]